jgi:hypothetical protein
MLMKKKLVSVGKNYNCLAMLIAVVVAPLEALIKDFNMTRNIRDL